MSYEMPRNQKGLLPRSRPPSSVPFGFQRQVSYDENSYEHVLYQDINQNPDAMGKSENWDVRLPYTIGSNAQSLPIRASDQENERNYQIANRKTKTRRFCSLLYSCLFLTIGFSLFLLFLNNLGYLDRRFPLSKPSTPPPSTSTLPTTTKATTKFTTVQPVPTSRPATLGNCSPGWTKLPLTGYCYKKIYHKTDFNGALKVCQSEDANLTSIHSEEENSFLADLHRNDEKIYDNYNVLGLDQEIWIGLHFVSGKWQWVDGTPVDYENWAPNEPNRMETEIQTTMVTSKLLGYSPEGKHWNNAKEFTRQKGLICKKAPMEL